MGRARSAPPAATAAARRSDTRDRVSDSGWREAPRLRDLTELHFGSSTIQVDTGVVPVAEVALDPSDSVFFEHHAMLWKDDTRPDVGDEHARRGAPAAGRHAVRAERRPRPGPAGLLARRRPARWSFCRSTRAWRSRCAGTRCCWRPGTLTYSFTKVPGLRTMFMAGTGMYFDQFTATDRRRASSSCTATATSSSERWRRARSIQLEPGGFLYKDSSVTMEIINVDIGGRDGSAAARAAGAKQFAGKGFRGLKAMRELMSDGVAGAAGQLMGGGGAALAGVFSSNSN